jgi:hypothetical protein
VELRLTAITGAYEGTVIVVPPGDCVSFGRTNASQRSFPQDTHMSSQHFEVENFGDRAEVRDRGSTNGTWLNSHRIVKEPLKSGDQLRAGITVFAIDFEYPPSSEIPSEAGAAQSAQVEDDAFKHPHPLSPDSAADARPEIPGSPPLSSPVITPLGGSSGRPSGRLNPFTDSIEIPSPLPNVKPFEGQSNASETGPVPEEGQQARAHISPFSDSIFVQPSQTPVENSGISGAPKPSDVFSFFKKRLDCSEEDGWVGTVDSLSRFYSVQVVLHPLKIRQSIPVDCESILRLWNYLGDAAEIGPIALSWADFKNHFQPFISRLTRADGLMVFLGDSRERLAECLQNLSRANVPGFSEADGLFTCFWPSSLMTILVVKGKLACSEVFNATVAAVLMPSPSESRIILAAGDSRFSQYAHELGFDSVTRLLDA